jgi:4-hydroxybenzoate polyprenyltransferase
VTILKSLRVHQWVKNFLVFIPIFLNGRLSDYPNLLNAFYSFIAFSLVASGMYIINDFADIENDRLHRDKSKRPIALGLLSYRKGLLVTTGIVSLGLLISWKISPEATAVLLLYILLVALYSFFLKKIYFIDVLMLTGFFQFRLGIGGIATNTHVTDWLYGFSFFCFLSLALAKRYAELISVQKSDERKILSGRGYEVDNLNTIKTIGIGSAVISISIYMIYFLSNSTDENFKSKWILIFSIIGMVFWISRVWKAAIEKRLDSDPTVFVLKDVKSLILIIFFLLTYYISMVGAYEF